MNEDQLKALPESIHDWDEVKNSDTPEVFWDRMSNMRKKIGTGLYKPGDDAGKEDVAKFLQKAVDLSNGALLPRPDADNKEAMQALYSAMGRPEEAGGYEFTELDGNEINPEYKTFISDLGHSLNLTKAQLKGFDEVFRTRELNTANDATLKFKDELKALNQEWGFAYDQRVHMAKGVAKTFFPHLGESVEFSAPELRAFYSISKQFKSGGKEFSDQNNDGNNFMSPDDASIQISEIRNNTKHPYHDSRDPGFKAAKKKMRELYLIKNGLPAE